MKVKKSDNFQIQINWCHGNIRTRPNLINFLIPLKKTQSNAPRSFLLAFLNLFHDYLQRFLSIL